jgi:hypothetical protein
MKRKIVDSNEPPGDIEVAPDFLPPPAELAFREDGVKVTLASAGAAKRSSAKRGKATLAQKLKAFDPDRHGGESSH